MGFRQVCEALCPTLCIQLKKEPKQYTSCTKSTREYSEKHVVKKMLRQQIYNVRDLVLPPLDPTPLFKEQLTLLPQNDIGGGRWCGERGGAEEKVN